MVLSEDILTVVASDVTFTLDCVLLTAGVVTVLCLSTVVFPEAGTGVVVSPVCPLVVLITEVTSEGPAEVPLTLVLSRVDFLVPTIAVVISDDGLSLDIFDVTPTVELTGDTTVTLVFVDTTPGVVAVVGTTTGVVTTKRGSILIFFVFFHYYSWYVRLPW